MKQHTLTHPKLAFCFLVAISFLAIFAGSGYALFLADLPPISTVEERLKRPTTQILDRNGRLLYEVVDPDAGKQLNLELDVLPPACIQATIATEDGRFFYHPGIDPLAILRAAWQNSEAGGIIVSGGSTLTQQLARNLLMEPEERYERTLRRKLREAWLAWQLEFRYTKDELLALYLNQTYYGNFAFGIEAAAQVFFAKPAAQLSRAECALLAGLVQYPYGYNPLLDPDAARQRQLTVLRLMHHAGYINGEEMDLIAAEPLRYRSHLFEIEAPHFVMYVQDLLARELGAERLRDGGLRVTTSLDLGLQQRAEAAVRRRLALLNCRSDGAPSGGHCDRTTDPDRRVDNAAAVVLDGDTGGILAMVGSPDYFDETIGGNVNSALALRQPGSAIKPLTYAAAMDPSWSEQLNLSPLTPASIIADLPTTFYVKDGHGGHVPYQPLNYDRRYHGPVSVRTALANSYNIPAVKVADRIGVATLQQLAAEAGIGTFAGDYGLALTLGGGEVRLLELTAAYGILQDGQRLDPRAILAVESMDREANGPAASTPNANVEYGVIAPATAHLLTDILADPVARRSAFGANSVLELPFPAAVKTGTTTDWRDNWTVGYSSERLVGVWVGNADNAPMLDVSGVDGAGPIWRDLMLAAHPGDPPAFAAPDEVVEQTICAPSGLLPSPDCPRLRRERFIAGTAPTRVDDQFQRIAIDLATDRRAVDATPVNRRAERVFWMLPTEYHDWMTGQGIAITPPTHDPILAASTPDNAASGERLILSAPTSNIAYQIHPGIPRTHQRIEVAGYSADARPWRQLRLMVDGETIAEGETVGRLDTWWPLEVGEHHFWIEGLSVDGDEWVRSATALVVVEEYAQKVAASSDGSR